MKSADWRLIPSLQTLIKSTAGSSARRHLGGRHISFPGCPFRARSADLFASSVETSREGAISRKYLFHAPAARLRRTMLPDCAPSRAQYGLYRSIVRWRTGSSTDAGRRVVVAQAAPRWIIQVFPLINVGCWLVLAALLWRLVDVREWRGWIAWSGSCSRQAPSPAASVRADRSAGLDARRGRFVHAAERRHPHAAAAN